MKITHALVIALFLMMTFAKTVAAETQCSSANQRMDLSKPVRGEDMRWWHLQLQRLVGLRAPVFKLCRQEYGAPTQETIEFLVTREGLVIPEGTGNKSPSDQCFDTALSEILAYPNPCGIDLTYSWGGTFPLEAQ